MASRTRSGRSAGAESLGTIRHPQTVRLADDLILADVEHGRERRAQPVRMDCDLPAVHRRKPEDVAAAAVDAGDPQVRPPARVWSLREHDRVGQLVPDQGLRAVHEAREQHLRARHTGCDGVSRLVDDLDHDRALEDVHPDVVERADCDPGRLGRRVRVDRGRTPRLFDPLLDLVGQHLRRRRDQVRLDVQATLELLVGERADDAGVGDERLGLIGIQRFDHLRDRCGHAQTGHSLASRLESGEELTGDVHVTRSTDRDQPGLRGHARPRERRQADGDPVGELLVREDEQAGNSRRTRGREDAVRIAVRGAGLGVGEKRFELVEPKGRVGDDSIEVLHQDRLRQRRQLGKGTFGRIGPERLAVVRRALDGVRQHGAEA